MKLFNYKFSRRHLAKLLAGDFATLDTIIIAYFISGDLNLGVKIGSIEILTKIFLYYVHERLWFRSTVINHAKRHIFKTFSWRLIGTIDTVLISLIVIGSFSAGLKIGFTEKLSKK